MSNPNNCETCDYKSMREVNQDDKQHCYMFYDTPNEQCMQHTGHRKEDLKFTDLLRSLLPKHTKGTS